MRGLAWASQRELYLADLASVGLRLHVARRNWRLPLHEQARRERHSKYGAHTIELLAVKPVPVSARA